MVYGIEVGLKKDEEVDIERCQPTYTSVAPYEDVALLTFCFSSDHNHCCPLSYPVAKLKGLDF